VRTRALFATLVAFVAACTSAPRPAPDTQQTTPNTLTAEEQAEGFKLLFDGNTLAGWRGYKQDQPVGWGVAEGTIHRVGSGGDLLTAEQYGDFELRLEWKIAPGGNSGIFFRGTEENEAIYWSAPEMQVLDDSGHANGTDPLTSAGSNFALHPAPRGVVRRAGEWNEVRLIVRGNHVEHWLNGTKVVEYELHSDDWKAKVAASKFAQWPSYGMAPRGHIALQDHGDEVWFRSVRIRTY
jgi:hypothetical protein